jgi:RHS repeat-associated protein
VSSVIRNGVTHPYTYDANGNQQSGPDMTAPLAAVTRTLTFNADNMPTQIVHPSGGTITLTYDGDSVRAKKSGPNGTTYYFSDTFELINNVETCYIFAGNLRVAMVRDHQTTTYFHKDHLGSSTAMTDAGGNTLEVTRYMPFGGKRGEGSGITSTAYGFTDQELDAESGLYNYDARLYDPIVGRFTSADYIIPDYYNAQHLNLYTYCRNNPMKYIDPTGHFDDNGNNGDTELFGHEGTAYGIDDGQDNTDHGGFDNYKQYLSDYLRGVTDEVLSQHESFRDMLTAPDVLTSWQTGLLESIFSEFNEEVNYAIGVKQPSRSLAYFTGRAAVIAAVFNAAAESTTAKASKSGASLYDDVTRAGSRYFNRATDVTKSQLEKNLIDSGFTRAISKNGKAIILLKDGAKYILRDAAKSTGGATADFYKAGSKSIDLKIRLGE